MCISEGKPYMNKRNILIEGKKNLKKKSAVYVSSQRSTYKKKNKFLFNDLCAMKDDCKQNYFLMDLITSVKRKRHCQYDDPKDSRR